MPEVRTYPRWNTARAHVHRRKAAATPGPLSWFRRVRILRLSAGTERHVLQVVGGCRLEEHECRTHLGSPSVVRSGPTSIQHPPPDDRNPITWASCRYFGGRSAGRVLGVL